MLRRYTWEKVREKCQHYRRRRPELSALYQVVHQSRQELEYCWEERFQAEYGVLRSEVLQVYDEYLNCGLLEHACLAIASAKYIGISRAIRLTISRIGLVSGYRSGESFKRKDRVIKYLISRRRNR